MVEGNISQHEGLSCPACRVDLVMSDRQGIEIDYCPKCRGVWLDRGELDKIIERSQSELSAPPQARERDDDRRDDYRDDRRDDRRGDYRDDDRYHGDHHGSRQRGRRGYRGFLSELFD